MYKTVWTKETEQNANTQRTSETVKAAYLFVLGRSEGELQKFSGGTAEEALYHTLLL